eukprot:8015202-Pyramimonas_sp.AAC.1
MAKPSLARKGNPWRVGDAVSTLCAQSGYLIKSLDRHWARFLEALRQLAANACNSTSAKWSAQRPIMR